MVFIYYLSLFKQLKTYYDERISIALENHKDHSENGFIGDSDNFTTNINVTPVVNDEATNLKQAILDVLEVCNGGFVPNIDWIKNRLNEAIS